jgi:hypothetical protein
MKTLLLLAALAAAACSDSTAPSASVKAASPDRLVAADDALDDLVITVAYKDGDGDLGGGTAEVYDCRADGVRTDLPLPLLAPAAAIGKPIAGTLELHVNDIGAIAAGTMPATCADLGVTSVSAGATVFCVLLVDAAGNSGDGDCTHEIAVTAE